MYLHLGQGTVVSTKTIVGIFDLDNTTADLDTREFLRKAELSGRVINVSEELPKSFVVCSEGGDFRVYISQMASATLLKRAENNIFE